MAENARLQLMAAIGISVIPSDSAPASREATPSRSTSRSQKKSKKSQKKPQKADKGGTPPGFAWSAFQISPDPSALPLPPDFDAVSEAKQASSAAESSNQQQEEYSQALAEAKSASAREAGADSEKDR
mmetsp:Transcript_5492/g.21701  ORF Transcript_5492/g.21701 Transcript_5492/m.21701 type:complete len:128 (+) Transcript_5492:142-525(+)|eukprot:scaffold3978_cov291-Pinguiococcus_pyrenoidosus.AAC.14